MVSASRSESEGEAAVRAAFREQARFCRDMDAPITARLCDALAVALNEDTRTGRRVLGWRGAPITDALPLRLVGGLHGVALAGDADAQALFSADTATEAVAPLADQVLRAHDATILPWLAGPPQTNEPGRAAALMLGLATLARDHGLPFDLLEIGSSAGLNLLLGRYAYDLGGVALGPDDAAVRLVPEWRGSGPSIGVPNIAQVRGVDIAPLDLGDPADALRLRSYVWAERAERLARLDAAIAVARADPPRIDSDDAADWVEARLAEPQAAGTMRVLMHSVVWQYLGPERQARITAAMHRAGARADDERPLGWVRMEPDRDLARHDLWIEAWPGRAGLRRIARVHAHGAWIDPAAGM